MASYVLLTIPSNVCNFIFVILSMRFITWQESQVQSDYTIHQYFLSNLIKTDLSLIYTVGAIFHNPVGCLYHELSSICFKALVFNCYTRLAANSFSVLYVPSAKHLMTIHFDTRKQGV